MNQHNGWREPGGGGESVATVAAPAGLRDGEAAAAPPEAGPLQAEYALYRRRQVAGLLRLMPRAAIRELYGQARSWAAANGAHWPDDPLATLSVFVERMLPLPPFEVWVADRERHPLGHLEDGDGAVPAATAESPHRAGSRSFDSMGRQWTATLHLFPDADAWRGFLRFRDGSAGDQACAAPVAGGADSFETAPIFLEDTPALARARFRSFSRWTLTRFLRSALP